MFNTEDTPQGQNPAHAGMNLTSNDWFCHIETKPRSRGDEPINSTMYVDLFLKTPLTRG